MKVRVGAGIITATLSQALTLLTRGVTPKLTSVNEVTLLRIKAISTLFQEEPFERGTHEPIAAGLRFEMGHADTFCYQLRVVTHERQGEVLMGPDTVTSRGQKQKP